MEPLNHAILDGVADVAKNFGDDLLSFLPVGSHADRDVPEELHNDYDFVFVLEGLAWERFRTLRRQLDDVAAGLSRGDHVVYVDDRVGPVKPHGDTPVVSMVQPLIFDREAFARYIDTSPFITLDWSRFPVWLGHKLTYYAAIGFPTVDQLLNARAGIRHYREMAAEQTVIALTPKNENGRFARTVEPLPVSDDLLLELYYSIVTRTMANALMVFDHDNSGVKRIELVGRFAARFPRLAAHGELAATLVELQGRGAPARPSHSTSPAHRRAPSASSTTSKPTASAPSGRGRRRGRGFPGWPGSGPGPLRTPNGSLVRRSSTSLPRARGCRLRGWPCPRPSHTPGPWPSSSG